MIKNLLECLGINAIIGKEKGMSAEQICELNVAFLKTFGFSEKEAFETVNTWKNECLKTGIFKEVA